jgi:hypothetical protein
MYEITKQYRIEVLLPPVAVNGPITPNYFPDANFLQGKTITGINIDIGDFIAFTGNNLPQTTRTPEGLALIADRIQLRYLYLTLYNTNNEIIFDMTPAMFFANWNDNYPNKVPGTRKKNIIPLNTKLDIRKCYVRGVPGLSNTLTVVSINLFYK